MAGNEGMTPRAMNETLAKVRAEIMSSQEQYGDFASMHEGYGVLAEEVAELFDALRLKQTVRERASAIAHEAIQIAAVATRIAEQAGRITR